MESPSTSLVFTLRTWGTTERNHHGKTDIQDKGLSVARKVELQELVVAPDFNSFPQSMLESR